jgi:NitT/TauT family transport system ATP-binding protein
VLGGEGVTVVYVTHDLGEAVDIGDRIVILSKRPARVLEVLDLAPGADRGLIRERIESRMEGEEVEL